MTCVCVGVLAVTLQGAVRVENSRKKEEKKRFFFFFTKHGRWNLGGTSVTSTRLVVVGSEPRCEPVRDIYTDAVGRGLSVTARLM